jgi:hypothetical protein
MFVYVVARDFGFAPNPFGGTCSLATCKPEIRRLAIVGDWILGTGTAHYGRDRHLVYAMKVTETMSFDQYWNDARFQYKKPHFRVGRKHAYGDNIYHQVGGVWRQANSHHSLADGSPNPRNVANDTQVNRILLSDDFVYFGGAGPQIPKAVTSFQGSRLLVRRGYRRHISNEHQEAVIAWIRSLNARGYSGPPIEW